ncbi:MAG: MATE family efflux transporter, partial [Sutterellaceae bacterium]|nr:MATE family efflux transporter [Sutterellaceae bacterium]
FITFFGKELLGCFTDVASVIALGWIRILYVVVPEPISVVMETVSAAMRGYGYSLPPAMVTLVCVCSIRIVWVYTVFVMEPTYESLMMVYPISWLVTAIVLVWLYFRHQKTLSPRRARFAKAA